MNPALTRRQLFGRASAGIGTAALASLLGESQGFAAPLFAPKAKRVIYLFMHGGPSQLDLFDHKPGLKKMHGQEFPASVLGDQRLTGMTSGQKSKPITSSLFNFQQHGQSGAWMSELLPNLGRVADEMCIIRSMNTEAINHDPAHMFMNTGSQIAGRPSLGSWIHYGLGSMNENLPAFTVLITKGMSGQPLYARLWGSGFLPSRYQGVQFRSGAEPVLYLDNPEGIDAGVRRRMLDARCVRR